MQENQIHPSAVIGPEVIIGCGVAIGPNAVILGPCTINNNVKIGANTIIGAPPEIKSSYQNLAWDGEINHAGVLIDSGVVIRENVVIHQGSLRETVIGKNSWILSQVYVAHDVQIGEDTVVSAGVSLGGHSTLGKRCNIGMNATIHQKRILGSGVMVGMSTPVTKDSPPYAKIYGSPVRLVGANSHLLSMMGVVESDILSIENLYSKEFFPADLKEVKLSKNLKNDFEEWLDNFPEAHNPESKLSTNHKIIPKSFY